MKQLVIIFLFSLGAVISSHAQSLKDLLFSGKLKNDSGTVIRKGEDLTGKLDTAAKKPAAIAIEKKPELQQVSQAGTQTATAVEPIANSTTTPQSAMQENASKTEPSQTAIVEAVAARKDNNAVWKAYADSLTKTLNTDLMPNKKIKSGTYYVLVDYAIETDGQISITQVTSSPENTFLQNMVRENMLLSVPKLNPILDGAGRARKVNRKQNLVLSK